MEKFTEKQIEADRMLRAVKNGIVNTVCVRVGKENEYELMITTATKENGYRAVEISYRLPSRLRTKIAEGIRDTPISALGYAKRMIERYEELLSKLCDSNVQ